jgi:hypothetical protein
MGGRAIGLSGVQVACADDPSALFSNPACIGYIGAPRGVIGSITPLRFGRSISNLAASLELGDTFHAGVGLVAMDAGTITRRDEAGIAAGTYTIWQGAAVAGLSYRLTDQSSIGISGRVLYGSAPEPAARGSGFGLDIGYVTSVFDIATVGVCLQNLGTMSIGLERFALPWMLRLGACTLIPFEEQLTEITSATLGTTDTLILPSAEGILLGIEAQYRAQSPTPTIIVGAEVVPHRLFAIRGGITLYGESLGVPQLFPSTFLSGGVSVQLPYALRLDYAIARGMTAALVHTLSIVARFD